MVSKEVAELLQLMREPNTEQNCIRTCSMWYYHLTPEQREEFSREIVKQEAEQDKVEHA